MPRKLVLIVVDGMTPAAFERAIAGGRAPALSFLAEHGDYRLATSVFPSLTPGLPHVDRNRRRPGRAPHPFTRLVEQAGAPDRGVRLLLRRPARGGALAVGARHDLQHERASSLPRGGDDLRGARRRRPRRGRGQHHVLPGAVSATCPHFPDCTVPCTGRGASSSTVSSSPTGRERRSRSAAARSGSPDAYAAAVGTLARHPATASTSSPTTSRASTSRRTPAARTARRPVRSLEQADAAIGALLEAAGGPDEFLERYAVVLLSDHGQTPVEPGGAAGGAVRGRRPVRSS